MASRVVNSLAVLGAASLLGMAVGSAGSLEALTGSDSDELKYTSADNPWAVGALTDDAPRWQRQAFVDHSQDGDPGSAEAAFASRSARPRSTYSGPAPRGCNAARAAGVAPMYRGDPYYHPSMDGDGDGVACEPHRGR